MGEIKPRPFAGSSARGGRGLDRGVGRGDYVPRRTTVDTGRGGQVQFTVARENGNHQIYRPAMTTASPSSQLQSQAKSSGSGTSNSSAAASSTGMINGSSSYVRPFQGLRGSWTPVSGQNTMADVVKSSSTTSTAPPGTASSFLTSSPSSDVSTVVHSPSVDPEYLVYSGPVTSMNQEAVAVKKHKAVDEPATEPATDRSDGMDPTPVSPLKPIQIPSSIIGCLDNAILASEKKSPRGVRLKSPVGQPQATSIGTLSEAQRKHSLGSMGTLGTRPLLSNHSNSRALYQTQQLPVGTQRAASGLEWKPKPSVAMSSQESPEKSPASEASRASPPVSSPASTEMVSVASSNLQSLNLQDDQPVIIPKYLQVPEAECIGLTFGSFGADFGSSFTAGLGSDDNKVSVEDATTAEVPSEQPSVASVVDSTVVSIAPSYSQQSTSATVVTLSTGNDDVLNVASVTVSPPEISKPGPIAQQNPQYSYLPNIPSYHGLGLMPQLQYPYESGESQPKETSRLPSFVQSFSDPSTNYFSPVFRPGSDSSARYQLASTNNAAKFSGNVTLMTGQSLPSQETVNPMVFSSGGAAGKLSQTTGIGQTTLAMTQQPLPIHAYPAQPAGVAISPYATNIFGYQYVPPTYAYMHAPYQHSFMGNNGYPQLPAGSSYAPAAGGTYPPAGAAPVKYPLPQFKPGIAAGNAPHAAIAAGYGSFATGPSGFAAVNPTVTAGSGSSYDDMIGPQYKESNLYIPSQQGEGSALWVHAPLSRDDSGMQTNSYYSLHGQGQHAGYTHAQPAHAHPATPYANLYQLSQSAPGPSTHQLLQQPQALGSVGAGSQAVAYQQPQRGQLNWTSNY